ncbi:MAG: ribosomal protein S18-alanine N-acetyltransferase [Alphaproteobacteria bacterium]|nr:ribosomal protein S18-alanine N-acetyltransferase [Alphaproteobacteria bacterium]
MLPSDSNSMKSLYASMMALIHETSFDEPWSEKAFSDLLSLPTSVAIINDSGFVLASAVANEAEILTIAVLPNCRKKGKGKALLKQLSDELSLRGVSKLFLEVRIDNQSALMLYSHFGFKEIGRRKGYYSGIDALTMEKRL